MKETFKLKLKTTGQPVVVVKKDLIKYEKFIRPLVIKQLTRCYYNIKFGTKYYQVDYLTNTIKIDIKKLKDNYHSILKY